MVPWLIVTEAEMAAWRGGGGGDDGGLFSSRLYTDTDTA